MKKEQHNSPATNSDKQALSQTLNQLNQLVRANTAPGTVLTEAKTAIENIRALLEPYQFAGPYSAAVLDGKNGEYNSQAPTPGKLMLYSPIIGELNPISPPLTFSYVDNRVVGHGTFPATFTGPPDTVHGGMIAAAFDELLTAVVLANGPSAFTGTLSVRYLNRTLIGKEVEFSAECTEIQERKVFARGELRQNGMLTASAEGVFIYPREPTSPDHKI